MSADLLKRLEAVTSRLEAYAGSLGSGGGRHESKGASHEESRAVAAYDEYYSSVVQPFIDNARKVKETTHIADWTEKAFKRQRDVILAAGNCKKPAQDALMKFVQPISDVMGQVETKVDNRSPFFNHQKAFAEGIIALGWVANAGASKPVINAGVEAADFYLVKILTASKTKSGDEQANLKNFATGYKETLSKLAEFAHENCKLGLDWNPKGGDLASFDPSGAGGGGGGGDDSGAGAPPPPGPPPSADDLRGSGPAPVETKKTSMGNVFDEINKGGAITSGLKKVTKDMKVKNMKDRGEAVVPVKKSAAAPAKKFGAAVEKKPSSLTLGKGTWFCEFYEDTEVEIKEVEVKQGVYISKCRNATITIPARCKAISIDGCFRTRVVFQSVVSSVELFNSQRCSVEILDNCPSVAIDKSVGSAVILSASAYKAPPQIVTSNISETNVVIPGATAEADPIEIPIPEQFLTLLVGGKSLKTEPVVHGD